VLRLELFTEVERHGEEMRKRFEIKEVLNDVGGAKAIKLLLEIVGQGFKVHRNESKTRECAFGRLPDLRLAYHGNVTSYGINKMLFL
jgi:hypothetical protein